MFALIEELFLNTYYSFCKQSFFKALNSKLNSHISFNRNILVSKCLSGYESFAYYFYNYCNFSKKNFLDINT